MKHNELQRKVSQALLRMGNGFSMVSSNRRGRPDIVGHIGAIFIAVEVKVGKDKASPQQKITIEDINNKGGIAIVVHENYYDVFLDYVARIEEEVISCKPVNMIGKPIPPELLPPRLEAMCFSAIPI